MKRFHFTHAFCATLCASLVLTSYAVSHAQTVTQTATPTPSTSFSAASPIASPTPSVVTSSAGNDALPSLEKPLSLDDSIRIALRLNGEIGASEQGFISAREGVTSARSGYFPQVSGEAGYNYNNRSTSSGVGFGSSTQSSTTTDIIITQNVFDSGRTRAQVRSAQARTLGAVGSVGSARSGLAFEVARNFYEQLRQERLVTQREGQVLLAQQQLEQIQAQIQAGVAARVDAQSVQVNLTQARFDLSTSQNDLRTAQTTFRNSLGLGRGAPLTLQPSSLAGEEIASATSSTQSVETTANAASDTVTANVAEDVNEASEPVTPNASVPTATPDAATPNATIPNATNDARPNATPTPQILDFPTDASAPLPIVPQLRPLEEYIEDARRLRPDLVQARASVAQSETAVSLARIASRPQITASAGYNIDPRSTGDRGFTFGAGVSIPIFDAGGRRADVRAAEAEREASNIRLTQLDKDVAADVETAFVAIGGQVERIANARALVESARTNLETATERYRLGLGIVLDVVNAQTQLFNAQTSATQAIFDYELARADLDRAIGRFAWADPNQAPPLEAPRTLPIATATSTIRRWTSRR